MENNVTAQIEQIESSASYKVFEARMKENILTKLNYIDNMITTIYNVILDRKE